MTIIVGPNILVAQLLYRRAALRLEIKGLRRRGKSACQICREAYDIRSRTRWRVLQEVEWIVAGIFVCRWAQNIYADGMRIAEVNDVQLRMLDIVIDPSVEARH